MDYGRPRKYNVQSIFYLIILFGIRVDSVGRAGVCRSGRVSSSRKCSSCSRSLGTSLDALFISVCSILLFSGVAVHCCSMTGDQEISRKSMLSCTHAVLSFVIERSGKCGLLMPSYWLH